MARYPSSSYRRHRDRTRRRRYIVSALLIVLVLFSVYRIIRRGARTTPETSIGSEIEHSIPLPMPEPMPEPNLSQIPDPTSESDPKTTKLINEAVDHLNAKPAGIIEARDRLNEVLPMQMSRRQQEFVKDQLSRLADKWLFGRTIHPQDKLCSAYKVKHGDQLRTIGRKYKVPYEILMKVNGIDRPEQLQAGQIIKIIKGPFHARIYRSIFTMDLYLQNTFVRSFPVGLGKQGRETPTGLWLVEPGGKIIKPTWRDPDTGKVYEPEDPDYPLGSRWIRLKGLKGDAVGRTGIAFHGTNDPALIGTAGSRGCIRLHNGDAILMYNLLMQGYSQVEIVE